MLQIIEESLPRLSPAEKRVAHWVLAHPRAAAGSTVAGVAVECGTSEPTVVRFCRRVGLSGFRELVLRLAEAVSTPATVAHTDVSAEDTTSDAIHKVFDASIRTLIDMRGRLSGMPFDAAVKVLTASRQIAFAGLGASGHVANDAGHKFFRLGVPCTSLTDPSTILQFAAISAPGDTLVLLSHSGRWPALAKAARAARANGATVIALTEPDSAVALEADLLFACRDDEDPNLYTPMSSRLAHLALLDALQVALALALGMAANDRLRRSKQILAGNLPRADGASAHGG